jgi:hypothetical protein
MVPFEKLKVIFASTGSIELQPENDITSSAIGISKREQILAINFRNDFPQF